MVGNGDASGIVRLGAGEEDNEPFLRLLRRAERSDSGVEGFAEGLGESFGL